MSKEEAVDLTGTVCPYTQLSAIRAIQGHPSGTFLKISVDNKDSFEAVVTVMKNSGHRIIQTEHKGAVYTILVQKK